MIQYTALILFQVGDCGSGRLRAPSTRRQRDLRWLVSNIIPGADLLISYISNHFYKPFIDLCHFVSKQLLGFETVIISVVIVSIILVGWLIEEHALLPVIKEILESDEVAAADEVR